MVSNIQCVVDKVTSMGVWVSTYHGDKKRIAARLCHPSAIQDVGRNEELLDRAKRVNTVPREFRKAGGGKKAGQ